MKTFTRNRRRKYIEAYAYAPDFINKLETVLGDRATALRSLDGLDAWFIACLHSDNRMIGMPSEVVDIAWHEFILRTREYTAFCERAFGQYLHHTPDSVMRVSATSLLPATLEIVERHSIPMVLFTADEDSGWDGGHVYSSTDLHRMRDTYAHAPRKPKRRYTYSSSAGSGYAGGSSGGCGGFFGGGDGGGGGSSCSGGGGCGGGGCGGGG